MKLIIQMEIFFNSVTSYVRAANRPDLRKIPIDPANPCEYVEELHQNFGELIKRVMYIEDELITLQENKSTTLTQPQVSQKHLVGVANASTQIEKKIAAEKMEIEVKERRWIRCSSLEKNIF